ncbi:beta-1,3-galactosyltransferase 5-like [Vanessa atalanta]|uniref:beta-1,3-galactosyltransferase 5-like n=1 Tax=Vanessa atalanta TaxID=42275 RepID=UPI000E7762AC|nr:beta-1,3-galactosyltransferase 5-like [Vanessa tameamea]XP_047537047.1 beta-1,3-galactosyltransferase 5-like [Vanessa atalanta]
MKMPKKLVFLIIIALISLLIWIYHTSNFDYNSSVLVLKQNNYFRSTLIQPSNTSCNRNPFLVIIITSYVGHVELRSAHRRAMPPDYLASLRVTRIFLLAKIPTNERYITQEAINDENNTYGDILQGSFFENYRNLTHKHLMGLEWASSICKNASFILKVDDDTVFNFNRTYNFLKKLPKGDKNLLMGYVLNNTLPRRNKQNKWYVTFEEYNRNIYPPYLSGWYYIISPKIASVMCEEAMYNTYFWIDDIFVTGLLSESLGLKLKELPKNFWLEYYELLECCLRDMVTKSMKCDYVVGPNGGRNNLIVEFNEAYNNCQARNCTQRPKDHDLKTDCIVGKERAIFSDGQAEVHHINL